MKFETYLIESEIQELSEKLKEQDDYLKAPNGKKSNLPEKQWLMIRTKSFKKWFGDWENSPETASQAVDKNGEPMIYYHVSDAEFTEFKASWRGLLFFAKTEEGARKGTVKGDAKLYKVFLNCRKIKGKTPIFYGDAESKKYQQKVIADGFDAINIRDEAKGTLAVFKSNQVKSIDNLGTFKVTSNHIHENTEYNHIMAYHGSVTDFDKFKVGSGMLGNGIYFTPNKKRAEVYPKMHMKKTGVNGDIYIYEVKLTIDNPLVLNELPVNKIDAESVKKRGYDAIILLENGSIRELTVFDNDQVEIVNKTILK